MDGNVFQHDFWGEKNQGFNTLYHNMKHGHNAAKEFAEFLRERENVEDASGKTLVKQAKTAASPPPLGTFGPLWQQLRTSKEQIGVLHIKLSQKLRDLAKEIADYGNSQKDKHKTIKDEVTPCAEAVNSLETAQTHVQKTKKVYNQMCHDLEEAKEAFLKSQKEGHKVKEQERLETRMKKLDQSVLNAELDYKAAVTKHDGACRVFEEKMHAACQRFEKVEDEHLQKMHLFVTRYIDVQEELIKEMQEALQQVRAQTLDQTIPRLFEDLIKTKGTGKDRPVPAKFEQSSASSTPLPTIREASSPPSFTVVPESQQQQQPKDIPRSSSASGLRKTLGLKRLKRKKKPKDSSIDSTSSATDDVPVREVDAEGYSIRPADAERLGETGGNESDFSYESDDEPSNIDQNKLRSIRIRPVDDSEQFKPTLSSSSNVTSRSFSSLDAPGQSRIGALLVPLNNSETNRSLTKGEKTGSHNSLLDLDIDVTANLPRALTEMPDTRPRALTAGAAFTVGSPRSSKPSPSGGLLAPPPGSRAAAVSSQPGSDIVRTSTPTQRDDDAPALPRKSKSPGQSQGSVLPSPINSPSQSGADVAYPIAIAFSEVVNAMFKDPDPNQCLVKVTGDMMISFPTAVVQRLASHTPSTLPPLSLQIVHANELEHVLPNTHLLKIESQENNAIVLKFSMESLVAYLKRQVSQSPSSSYHNADILKYQVKNSGTSAVPLILCSHWKCEPTVTNLKVDYSYNSSALVGGQPLTGVVVFAPVNGGVQSMNSKPDAAWSAEQSRVLWKINEIQSPTSSGSVQAQFNLSSGPGSPSPVAVQFLCEGTTMSGINIQIISAGYRLSLLKKTFKSGKYTAEQR